MKPRQLTSDALNQFDMKIITLAWDAEQIAREANAATYCLWPPTPGDAVITKSIGVKIANTLKNPILIWRNSPEET